MDEPVSLVQPPTKKVPLPLKIFGVLLILFAVLTVPLAVILTFMLPFSATSNGDPVGTSSLVIMIIDAVLSLVSTIVGAVLGVNLLRDKRRGARQAIESLLVVNVAMALCDTMIVGLGANSINMLVRVIFLVVLMTYIDPSLSQERALKRKLRDLETKERAEEGTLGLDETGKGFIQLDFFNLFWIFVVCCVLGLIIEVAYHMIVVDPGVYQDRAGMLYGPFSPIYGVGAVLMTIALNRFHDKNILIIFLVSAIIGGAFEYFVSWFMQFAFGIVAWDYTGTFLSIDGRTNGMFMAMWGILGCFWIKLCLPKMLELINMIPWQWRYGVTSVCAALMLVNAGMTLLSLDCWYQREAGQQPENAMEEFFAEHYDNEFMADRFQSMSIDPSNSTRTK